MLLSIMCLKHEEISLTNFWPGRLRKDRSFCWLCTEVFSYWYVAGTGVSSVMPSCSIEVWDYFTRVHCLGQATANLHFLNPSSRLMLLWAVLVHGKGPPEAQLKFQHFRLINRLTPDPLILCSAFNRATESSLDQWISCRISRRQFL